jgi:hypothetical protein
MLLGRQRTTFHLQKKKKIESGRVPSVVNQNLCRKWWMESSARAAGGGGSGEYRATKPKDSTRRNRRWPPEQMDAAVKDVLAIEKRGSRGGSVGESKIPLSMLAISKQRHIPYSTLRRVVSQVKEVGGMEYIHVAQNSDKRLLPADVETSLVDWIKGRWEQGRTVTPAAVMEHTRSQDVVTFLGRHKRF